MSKAYWFSLVLLGGVWAIFFAPLVTGSVYFLDDLKIIYLPLETLYASFQQAWQLPVWSSEFGFGQPLLAWGQLGFFTPLHILLRLIFPPLDLLQVSVAFYFAAGLVGFWYFLLRRGYTHVAACAGSIVFTFSGFAVGHLNHVNFYTAVMLLPWLLASLDSFFALPTLRRAVLLAILTAVMALSGQPQIVVYCFGIAALWAVVSIAHRFFSASFDRTYSFRILGFLILAGILAFSMASFSILPLTEFLPTTDRADDLSVEELLDFSYPPYHAITLIFPYFFGNHAHYFGPKGFQELAAFVGIIPLLSIGIALSSWKQFKIERIFGLLLLGSGGILALGNFSPLYRWLVQNHYITSLSIPGRFVLYITTGVALLTACALNDLTQPRDRRERLASLAAAITGVVVIFTPFAVATRTMPWLLTQLAASFSPLRPELWLLIAGSGALLLIAIIPKRTVAPVILLTSIIAATLLIFGWDYSPRSSRADTLKHSAIGSALLAFRHETGLPARVYARDELLFTEHTSQRSQPPPSSVVETKTLARHLQALYGTSSARWIGALSIKSYREFIEDFFANDYGELYDGDGRHVIERNRKFFDLAGVTHFIQFLPTGRQDRMEKAGFALVTRDQTPWGEARLYSNPTAYPKAFVVASAIFQPVAHDARLAMHEDSFDPKELIYVDGPTPPTPLPEVSLKKLSATARIVRYKPTVVDVVVDTPEPAWLVVTDATTREWHTFIDGAAVPYYTADTVFKTAWVPAGQHTVSFKYDSSAVARAKQLTIGGGITAAVLVMLSFLPQWLRRPRRDSATG